MPRYQTSQDITHTIYNSLCTGSPYTGTWQTSQYIIHMGRVARKPVLRVSDKTIFKPVSTATKTS